MFCQFCYTVGLYDISDQLNSLGPFCIKNYQAGLSSSFTSTIHFLNLNVGLSRRMTTSHLTAFCSVSLPIKS